MEQLSSGALLDAVRGVHWPARRVTRGVFQGGHRSRRVGSSPEFMEYRPYRKGDEASRIDWKLFGRTERIAIRLTHDDSSFRTMVLVDASLSMAYPTTTLGKWNLASSIGLGLCAVAHGDSDPVGIAVVNGEEPRIIPPRTRFGTVSNVLHLLSQTTPGGTTPLSPVLNLLRANRRIAIISDFLGDAEELMALSRQMVASGREVFFIHIVAREELEPAARGNVVVDPEDEHIKRPFDVRGLAEYTDAFTAWRQTLADQCRSSGIFYTLGVTDEAPDQVVRRIAAPVATAHESW